MTSTRYFFARIALAFGINRRNQRMSDAAAEMHLLRDAEAHLGAAIWDRTEHIEKVSSEYWNLRKISREREGVEKKMVECQERLAKAHEERAGHLNGVSDPEKELLAERTAILTRLSGLALRRDEVIEAAKEIRKAYDGLKVKSEVLAGQAEDSKPNSTEFEKINQSLSDLKAKFSSLKSERMQIAKDIESGDKEVDAIVEKIRLLKKSQVDRASKASQIIGDANRDISLLRAEIGLLEMKMAQLLGEIGKHVSRNTPADPACTTATKDQMALVNVMSALRKSITLNHRLSER